MESSLLVSLSPAGLTVAISFVEAPSNRGDPLSLLCRLATLALAEGAPSPPTNLHIVVPCTAVTLHRYYMPPLSAFMLKKQQQ
jgi:hypothetical protein